MYKLLWNPEKGLQIQPLEASWRELRERPATFGFTSTVTKKAIPSYEMVLLFIILSALQLSPPAGTTTGYMSPSVSNIR